MTEHTEPLVIDAIDKRRLDLLQKTVAKGATGSELASFLEICAKYDLDPFANEAWCAVSQKDGGKRSILLMVGRDGLRKIAMRQGFIIDGDVVREKDDFAVTRNPDRTRTIRHSYALKDRGPIIGAWAEIVDSTGKQRGYFFAPMDEYRPKSEAKLRYSPWGSQESVMILAAAERTALGMATPLSGVVAQGELDRADEQRQITAGEVVDIEPLPEAVQAVIERAMALGHAQLSDVATVQMMVDGQPEPVVELWVAQATDTLDAYEAGGALAEDGPKEADDA
jgi:hypothetical protein